MYENDRHNDNRTVEGMASRLLTILRTANHQNEEIPALLSIYSESL